MSICFASLLFLLTAWTSAFEPETPFPQVHFVGNSRTDAKLVYERFRPAVVMIRTKSKLCGGSLGSGFFASPDGEVVTNLHVIGCGILDPASSVSFEFEEGKKTQDFRIGTCGRSKARDICILKLNHYPERHFRLSKSFPKEGAVIYTIGNPGGSQFTLMGGEYLGRRNHGGVSEILTNLPTIPGNSGGPIFTKEGWLVGVHYRSVTYSTRGVPKKLQKKKIEKYGISSFEVAKMQGTIKQFLPRKEFARHHPQVIQVIQKKLNEIASRAKKKLPTNKRTH